VLPHVLSRNIAARKVDARYPGVYKSGAGFNPDSVTGLKLWFKADSIVAADDDPVGTWTDSSTSAKNLTQATGSKQPLYKTAVLNGKPVVRFDGTDDTMATAALTLDQPLTYLMVVKMNSSTGTRYLCDGASNDSLLIYNGGGGAIWVMYAGGAAPSKATDTTAFHVFACKFDGASSEFYVDSGTAATGNCGANNAGGLTIGSSQNGSNPSSIDVAEWLAYDSALGNTDRVAVRDYLLTKYGL
jgi:hypothetical protein